MRDIASRNYTTRDKWTLCKRLLRHQIQCTVVRSLLRKTHHRCKDLPFTFSLQVSPFKPKRTLTYFLPKLAHRFLQGNPICFVAILFSLLSLEQLIEQFSSFNPFLDTILPSILSLTELYLESSSTNEVAFIMSYDTTRSHG